MSELAYEKNLVDDTVMPEDAGAAVKLLFDLIVENAKARNFAKAEALREKLFEVDSMALHEILRSGEIIEAEKTGAMDKNHLKIWSNLYSTLTTEEANALYYSLKEENVDADSTLFEQGKPNDRLFFINGGDLKMVYSAGDKEMLLKNYSAGDLVGGDAFFGISLCTTSLITLSRVHLHLLEETALGRLEKDFPGIPSKLRDYCLKLEQVPDLLKKKNLDRRMHERIGLKGPVFFQLVKKSGEQQGKPFRGTLSDISVGGLSFFIKTPKKETVRLLLGRKLNLKFSLSSEESGRNSDVNVTVVGVCDHFFNDFSIHIKFDQPLDQAVLAGIKA